MGLYTKKVDSGEVKPLKEKKPRKPRVKKTVDQPQVDLAPVVEEQKILVEEKPEEIKEPINLEPKIQEQQEPQEQSQPLQTTVESFIEEKEKEPEKKRKKIERNSDDKTNSKKDIKEKERKTTSTKSIDSDAPPKWFTKFISEVGREEGVDKKQHNKISKQLWDERRPRQSASVNYNSGQDFDKLFRQIFGR